MYQYIILSVLESGHQDGDCASPPFSFSLALSVLTKFISQYSSIPPTLPNASPKKKKKRGSAWISERYTIGYFRVGASAFIAISNVFSREVSPEDSFWKFQMFLRKLINLYRCFLLEF